MQRMPGLSEAVQEHEEWGDRARNMFILVGLLEIGALALTGREERRNVRKGLLTASALLGVVGLGFVFEAGDKGGDIVYEYGGGVGTRSGNPRDVQNLLAAGLYNGALEQRKAGNPAEAAHLMEELVRLRPADPAVKLLGAQSLLQDKNDARGALDAISRNPAGHGGPNAYPGAKHAGART